MSFREICKVIITRERKILLLARSESAITETSPWSWDLPGGHVEEGEEIHEAAARETEEETQLRLVDQWYMHSCYNKNKSAATFFYVSEIPTGEVILSSEHRDFRWVPYDEISDYKQGFSEEYYKMLRHFVRTESFE